MFVWKKLGKVFDPRDMNGAGWMREFAQSPSVVLADDHLRAYFCSRPAPDPDGQYRSYIGFIDLDRADPRRILRVCERPVLDLGGFGTFDEFGTYPVSVIRDGDEIRAYYAGWTRCESVPFNAAIGVAISRDGGESFQRLGAGPVLSYCPDEPFLIGSPRIRRFGNRWQLWYVAGKAWLTVEGKPEPVYKIRMATSDDGIEWTRHGRDLIADKLGAHECQACPDVTYRDGRYHMFFSWRDIRDYKGREGGYRIGYASSPDMVTWERDDDQVVSGLSETGWDSEMVNYPHVFEMDGATWMLYQGNGMGREGFGLAVLGVFVGVGAAMKWKKLGKIFDPTDHKLPNRSVEFAQSPQALVLEDRVRVYFSTRERDSVGKYLSHVAYADYSRDMRRLLDVSTHQVLPLGGLGCFDEHGIFPFSVFSDGDRILAYTTGWNRKVSVSADAAIGLAVSRDNGLTFEKLGTGPILAAALKEPFLVGDAFVLKRGDTYHMWYIFGVRWIRPSAAEPLDRVYKIAHASSPDGIRWQRDARPIIADRLNPDECQALPTVIFLDGTYHMVFCYREAHGFRTDSCKAYRIGYARSADLVDWERDDALAGIHVAPDGWDSGMQCYPHVFECDGAVYLLYNGNEFGRHGFGLAVLQR